MTQLLRNSSAARELVWEGTESAAADIERREWRRNFALAIAWIVLTLAVTAALA